MGIARKEGNRNSSKDVAGSSDFFSLSLKLLLLLRAIFEVGVVAFFRLVLCIPYVGRYVHCGRYKQTLSLSGQLKLCCDERY